MHGVIAGVPFGIIAALIFPFVYCTMVYMMNVLKRIPIAYTVLYYDCLVRPARLQKHLMLPLSLSFVSKLAKKYINGIYNDVDYELPSRNHKHPVLG